MAAVLSAPPESIGQRAAGRKVPMALWEKYGLASPGWLKSRAGEPRYAKLPRAARFRLALEEGDGLFPFFGRFLAGRADLLPSPYLYELRKIRPSQMPSPAPSLEGELARQISGFEGIRATPGSEVFSALYQNRPIVVEVYRRYPNSVIEKSWDHFRSNLQRLKDGPEAVISRAPVLEHFWDWLNLQGDIERKRMIVGNLEKIPGNSVSRFPRLIPDLQSPTCLVYEGMEGTPLDKELLPDSSTGSKSLQVLAEGILEQSLLLSIIDTEVLLENFLLLSDGGLGFRVLPTWVPVPVEWQYELLQYVASSAAGNTPRALQMLCRMSSSRDSYAGEQHLLNRLSSLQPELKINVVTPESVTVLENYWRALAGTPLRPPLFLQLFHRNLTLLGQCNESVAPSTDLIAEALWPVLGSILRFHLGKILSTEKGREWIVSSGLLFMSAVRQIALALEHLRDAESDLKAVSDLKDSDSRDAKLNRRTASLIRAAIALVVFLFLVPLAHSSGGGAMPFFSRAAAVVSAIALCVLVARIK